MGEVLSKDQRVIMARLDEVADFVRWLANGTRDGELLDGVTFIMENDDAFETLDEAIGDARELLDKPRDHDRDES